MSQEQSPRVGAWRWFVLAAAGALLLATSQALWSWQTWPVRELLNRPLAAPMSTTS